jgi:hypothetical protein
MKKFFAWGATLFFVYLVAIFLLSAPACKQSPQNTETSEEAVEEEQTAEAAEKPAEPKPRMNEDIYVEITARSALIWEKYKDEPSQAEKEVEALCEKFGLTFKEYKEYQSNLTPQKSADLQKRIQGFIQKVAHEYR